MYFIDALGYPYKSQGLFGKILVAFLLLVVPIINFFGGFVIMGYGVKIISRTMYGDPDLPEFDVIQDFMRGLVLTFASFIYMLPVWVVMALVFSSSGMTDAMMTAEVYGDSVAYSADFNSGAFFGGMLIITLLSIVLGMGLLVGMVRFASSGQYGMLFDIPGNFSKAFGNLGAVFVFFINAIFLAIIVGIGAAIGSIFFIIPGIIIGIAGQFSMFYLYARFAEAIGVAGKRKFTT